ncbi:MAG: pteridine reductase [Gammaproteobacteria bacterium]|nr:pteridine reductase [Gammaproteobacteria bacterium]
MTAPVVLITGAARRIGAVIATHLHEHDYRLIIHCHHSQEQARHLAESLNSKRPHSAHVIPQDLADIENLPAFIQRVVDVWGRLDALVNNASCFFPTPFGSVTQPAWQTLLNINLQSPFFLAQTAWPWLRQTEGAVVNITDIHARHALRDYSAYSVSKAGLLMATTVLAKEMAPQVRVNAVSPGAILWPEGINELSEQGKQAISQKTALKRAGTPLDIAQAVLYFLQASYVTGQVLEVDGGRYL